MTNTDDISRIHSLSECLVPHGTEMQGTVKAPEDIVFRIDGKFDGSLMVEVGGTVLIASTAEVNSKMIEADMIIVEGSVTGEINARRSLLLTSSCELKGVAQYGETVSVQPKARLNGQIKDSSWV